MTERRNTYTAVLFLAGLFAGAVFLCLGLLPEVGGFTHVRRPETQVPSAVTLSVEEAETAPRRTVERAIRSTLPLSAKLPDAQEAGETLETAIDGSESAVNTLLDRNHTFIELYGGAQRLLGRRSIEDAEAKYTVVRMDNGLLTFASPADTQTDMAVKAREMTAFARRVRREQDIPVLYVQAPSKLDVGSLPLGVENYADAEADQFLSLLGRAGVDTLDLRPLFRQAAQEDPKEALSLFFRTDHHWTPQGAFLGFQAIGKKLAEDYGFSVNEEYLDETNYDKYVLEGRFLGSQGKRVGSLYAGVDDVEIWAPTFSTDFTYTVPMSGIKREGPFAVSLLFPEQLADEGSLYDTNPYTVWSGGDFILARAENRKDPDAPRILILRDSYGCALTPFLSLLGSETMAMDPRLFNGDQDEMLEYIDWLDPDLVIVLNTTSSLRVDTLFPYLPTSRAAVLAEREEAE